jgi:hypothetical protein
LKQLSATVDLLSSSPYARRFVRAPRSSSSSAPAIDVRVVNLDDWIQAEHDENEERKDFSISERVAIKKAIEKRIGERRGKHDNVPHGAHIAKGDKSRDYAAQQAGFGSHETARRAECVVEKGAPELIEAVDRGEGSGSGREVSREEPARRHRL